MSTATGATDSPRVDRIWSTAFAVTLVAALATTLMLEATRVFLAYTLFVVDQAERTKLALNAGGTFLLIALGGALILLLRPRGAVALSVALLVAARLAFQFTDDPDWRRYLGAAAVIAWGWMLPALRSIRADETARGVVFGLLLDLSLRFLLGTVDLPWMPDISRHVITVALVLILLAALVPVLVSGRGGEPAAGPALIGIGPGLALFHLATGNLGIAEVKSSLAVEIVVWLFAIGLAAGFVMQIRPADAANARRPLPGGWANAAALTVLGLLGLLIFWRWDGAADIAAVLATGVGAQLLLLAARGRDSGPPTTFGDSLWLTLGLLVHAAVVFAYFSATGFPLLLGVAFVLLGLGAALSARRGGQLPALAAGRHVPAMVAIAALLLLLGLVTNRDLWSGVDRRDTLGRDLTVMTYNLQAGFSVDNHWDLEAQAKVIEARAPDIVILQEVNRGWVIMSGTDQARWLAHRLDMNLAWGPSANDGMWGVAILTRAKLLGSEMRMFSSTQNLQRGVLGAVLPTEGGQLWVYATHLDNPSGAGAVRLEQVTQLVTVADATPAIVAGDFNATPDSDTVAAMLAAGFVDTGAGPNVTTSEDGKRIDYIFARGPFRVVDAVTPEVWTSDHKPFVAKLTLA